MVSTIDGRAIEWGLPVREDVLQYLAWMSDVRRMSPQTVRSYGITLWCWERWDAAEPSLAEMEDFCNRTRAGGKPPSASAVARDMVALKSYFGWRCRVGLADKNPADDLIAPKRPHGLPRALPDDVWVRLWTSPHVGPQDRVWLGLGFFCGLRRAELSDLRAHHWDAAEGRLVGFKRKGGGDHTVPVRTMLDVYRAKLPHLRADLLHIRNTDPLCGVASAQMLHRQLNRLIGWTGVPRFTPHALRHSAVTNLLRAEVPLHLVSRLMNHTSTTTTMRYVRAGGNELTEWLNSTST